MRRRPTPSAAGKCRILPALLLSLAILLPACREAPATPKAVPLAEDGALRLTLASFNIRYENPAETDWRAWPNRIDRIVKTIRELDPDVFGIQEALIGRAHV